MYLLAVALLPLMHCFSQKFSIEKEISKLIIRQDKIHENVLFDYQSYEYYFKRKNDLFKNGFGSCLLNDSLKELYVDVESIVKFLPRANVKKDQLKTGFKKRIKNLCVGDTNLTKKVDLLSEHLAESLQKNTADIDSLNCVSTVVSYSSHIELLEKRIHRKLYKLFMLEGVIEYPSFYLVCYRIAREDRQWSKENCIEIIFK